MIHSDDTVEEDGGRKKKKKREMETETERKERGRLLPLVS